MELYRIDRSNNLNNTRKIRKQSRYEFAKDEKLDEKIVRTDETDDLLTIDQNLYSEPEDMLFDKVTGDDDKS